MCIDTTWNSGEKSLRVNISSYTRRASENIPTVWDKLQTNRHNVKLIDATNRTTANVRDTSVTVSNLLYISQGQYFLTDSSVGRTSLNFPPSRWHSGTLQSVDFLQTFVIFRTNRGAGGLSLSYTDSKTKNSITVVVLFCFSIQDEQF